MVPAENDSLTGSLVALRQALKAGDIDSATLVEDYRHHIDRHNLVGACVNGILEMAPDLESQARDRDRERRAGHLRGPLHGIPILLKDNLVTADGLNTSYGSYYLQGVRYGRDSTVADRLRRAGALVMGKANMVEFGSGMGRPSGRGGPVRNPYDLLRGADGSSNGLCASIAAGFAPAGVGSDSRCSIRFPAADCCLVGLKPTFGLISRGGLLPGDPIVDVVGPVARRTEDVALLLSVLAGPDDVDPHTTASPRMEPRQPTASWQGVRVGVLDTGATEAAVGTRFQEALAALEEAGAEIVRGLRVETVPYGASPQAAEIFQAASVRALDAFFDEVDPESAVPHLQALRYAMLGGFFPSSKHRGEELADLDETLVRRCRAVTAALIDRARTELFTHQGRHLEEAMEKAEVEVLVFPTKNRLAAPLFPSPNPGPALQRGLPELASYSGWPELTLPAGLSPEGLPVGLSLLGRPFSEPRLLALGEAFERVVGSHRPPSLPATPPPIPHEMPPSPAHALFAHRLRLGSEGSLQDNLLPAVVESGEPRHGDREPVQHSVWYQWQAPGPGRARIAVEGSPGSAFVLAVYRGHRLAGLEPVTGNNFSQRSVGGEAEAPSRNDGGEVTFAVQGGETFQLVVGSRPGSMGGGGFRLSWEIEAED